MKIFRLIFLIFLIAAPAFSADIRSGEDLIAAMHKKYSGKWYKTLTFVQKTITHKPDGTNEIATWYEAMTVPGKLRIDIAPSESGNGILFADGKIFSFRDGKAGPGRPFIHPLMVLGFDAYLQPVDVTIGQLKEMKIDLATVHETDWQGKRVYVVGAKQGDLKSPQFWIEKKDLLFVRLLQPTGKDRASTSDTQFNKYVKVKGGGWVAPEVLFFVDGRPTMTEEYSDIQAGMELSPDLWNPEKWMSVDKSYYKPK